MRTWFSPPHEDDIGTLVRTIGTVLLLGAAVTFPLVLSFFGLLVGFLLIIVWYAWIGHHYSGLAVDRVAKVMRGRAVDPATIFEPQALKFIQQGHPDQALESCHAWIRHDARSAAPRLMAARVLATHLHQTDRAIRTLEVALLRPMAADEHVGIALYLAELYRRTNRAVEIAPVYQRLRSLYPRSPAILRLPTASD